jgi:hypothetical protein
VGGRPHRLPIQVRHRRGRPRSASAKLGPPLLSCGAVREVDGELGDFVSDMLVLAQRGLREGHRGLASRRGPQGVTGRVKNGGVVGREPERR